MLEPENYYVTDNFKYPLGIPHLGNEVLSIFYEKYMSENEESIEQAGAEVV